MFPEKPTATNVLFSNPTPLRLFAVGEVALFQEVPLSVDLTMLPESPTAKKVLFPKVTPERLFAVGEEPTAKKVLFPKVTPERLFAVGNACKLTLSAL